VTDKEALKLSLVTLERDNLKVGNTYVNYDIQKALIKLVKKTLKGERKKKKWQGLTDEEVAQIWLQALNFKEYYRAIEAKLKEKNT
jgi:hypothetical protein